MPTVGEISDKIFSNPIKINKKFCGRKSTSYKTIMEIIIDRESKSLSGCGKLVYDIYFEDYPKMLLNVCYSCGKPNIFRKGGYGDPLSIWYNVFLGYWEVDVLVNDLNRPYGYTINKNGFRSINKKEVLAIIKSDWNYFSNHIYGVPIEFIDGDIKSVSNFNKEVKVFKKQKIINGKKWDHLHLNDVKVVTTYQFTDGAKFKKHSFYTPLWHILFGKPLSPKKNIDEVLNKINISKISSFFPTSMDGEIFMTYDIVKDVDLNGLAYRTYFFGGSKHNHYPLIKSMLTGIDKELLNKENEIFLQTQMIEVQKIIEKKFSNHGFL